MTSKAPNMMRLFLGQVFGIRMNRTIKVKVTKMELDEYVMKYYSKPQICYVYDGKYETTSGDIVLIKELPVPRSAKVRHSLEKIVYQVGRTIDPITRRRCTYFSYLDDAGTKQTMDDVGKNQTNADME
ncbi:small ribosomal subunit protein uS17m-like [Saccoglossus kowalevskii]|uniref:28S ribosomal protein S17, mitochondrial-like n=1 Tax=Saccoglossus kowalevskii TaxID=10224 RepID=A0ABM0GU48_SACKO|nr:PREDICTED: 28S ribosomal protein S17, mitochondrial-like [Saccoglossus kowalevskii]